MFAQACALLSHHAEQYTPNCQKYYLLLILDILIDVNESAGRAEEIYMGLREAVPLSY